MEQAVEQQKREMILAVAGCRILTECRNGAHGSYSRGKPDPRDVLPREDVTRYAVTVHGSARNIVSLKQEAAVKSRPGVEGEVFITGTGQKLYNVHSAAKCDGGFCVIHNPAPGPWDTWHTHWASPADGRLWTGFERICPCGYGHPAVEETMRHRCGGVHACCGCPCGPQHITKEEQ